MLTMLFRHAFIFLLFNIFLSSFLILRVAHYACSTVLLTTFLLNWVPFKFDFNMVDFEISMIGSPLHFLLSSYLHVWCDGRLHVPQRSVDGQR